LCVHSPVFYLAQQQFLEFLYFENALLTGCVSSARNKNKRLLFYLGSNVAPTLLVNILNMHSTRSMLRSHQQVCRVTLQSREASVISYRPNMDVRSVKVHLHCARTRAYTLHEFRIYMVHTRHLKQSEACLLHTVSRRPEMISRRDLQTPLCHLVCGRCGACLHVSSGDF
jgi:hypothetical protein